MGRYAHLGDTAVNITGSLEVLPSGSLRFFVSGADSARVYVQVTAPVPEAAPRLVADLPDGTFQQLDLPWLPGDLHTPVAGAGYTAAGQTLTFTLRPVVQALEGPVLVTVVVNPVSGIPAAPTTGSYTGAAWWPTGTTPPPPPPPPPAGSLWDSITKALSGFPGGAPAAIGVGALGVALLLKRRQP